jgi:hypothetical protein
MAEWVKIIVSTCIGFLAGQIGELLKNAVQLKIVMLRMQRAIELDCLRVRTSIEVAHVGLVPEEKAWQGIKLQGFEYYWEKSRELFFSSLPLHLVAVHCQVIQNVQMAIIRGDISSKDGETQILKAVEEISAEMPQGGLLRRRIRKL